MACHATASETVVLRLKSRDISDVSLASSESSGCSSERSSVLRSPTHLDETPVLHGTESSVSGDYPRESSGQESKESKESDACTSSPTPLLPPPMLKKSSKLLRVVYSLHTTGFESIRCPGAVHTFSLLRDGEHVA
ncbi:hypothetical protein GCK32_022885 [Trichostrongylus colubriformis]|uniref:Uncharacterized protein n=1 Tax=Trichostrongylus colubriformis TaxID=6319 RepID=A0AAN8FA99_TRICO